MGKVVETVVTELGAEEAERRGLLSDGKFGSGKSRLAIDPAASIVDKAHAAWRKGSGARVLLMDIKAAFPSVGSGRLVQTMKGKRIEEDYIRWAAMVLSD